MNLFIDFITPSQVYNIYKLKLSLMFMSLFTNTLLYLSLSCLIVEPQLGLKLNLFVKQTNIISFFIQVEFVLLINSLVHLQS